MILLSETKDNVIECACGCLYKYEQSDLKVVLGTTYLLVECPKCGQQTILVMDTTNLKEMEKVIDATVEKSE